MDVPDITLLGGFVGFFLQDRPAGAVIVRLMPPKSDLATLSDVLLRALGLSGVLAIAGVVLGVIVGGIVFLVRYRWSA